VICDVRGKKAAQVRQFTRSYGNGARLLVGKNLPAISCPHCGEMYITAATLRKLERIKQ